MREERVGHRVAELAACQEGVAGRAQLLALELSSRPPSTAASSTTRACRPAARRAAPGSAPRWPSRPRASARWLERRFVGLCRRAGLPAPLVDARDAGYEVDAHWPAQRVVAETTAAKHHRTRRAFEDVVTTLRRLLDA